jgi:hypothetical protein
MPQFRLRSIMLLIATAAAWTAWYTGKSSIQREVQAISVIYPLQSDLLQADLHLRPNEYSCLLANMDSGNREYQCHLPPGREYELKFMWSKPFGLYDKSLSADVSRSIPAGKHQILLNEWPDKWVISVDGEVVMDIKRNRPTSNSSTSTGVSDRFDAQWHAIDQPLTLIRLHENSNGKFQNAAPGIALWIETTD